MSRVAAPNVDITFLRQGWSALRASRDYARRVPWHQLGNSWQNPERIVAADFALVAILGRKQKDKVRRGNPGKQNTSMDRYYRILLLFSLISVAVGIAGLLLEQRVVALVGCLIVPPVAYVVAVLIDLARRRD